MLGASLYIIVCSARNRLRVRLRRLKEPRYLIGAVAALAYFYFTIFARMWGQRARIPKGRRRAPPPRNFSVDAFRTIGPTFVGMALLLLMAAGWLFPGDGGLLDFSAAETQFLFPAPVARPANSIREVIDRLGEFGATGASHWILWPFMALAKPLFAEWPGPYLLAIGAAIAVLAANVAWVLWSDEAFQEATAEAEARRAA